MYAQPLPDLPASLRLQDQMRSLSSQLSAAGQELTTGQVSDIRAATRGDLTPVFAIDAELADLEARARDLGLAGSRAEAAQTALGLAETAAGPVALSILGAVSAGDAVSIAVRQSEAPVKLEQVMTALNTRFGGRTLFAGAAEDRAALAPAATLIADIEALIAGAPDAATARAAVDTYFGPGGGFETGIYQGATIDAATAAIDDTTRIGYLPRADATEIRETLKGLAMIAAAPAAGFAATPGETDLWLTDAANVLQNTADDVTALRATLGNAQAQIADGVASAETERNTLSILRNDLVGVDQLTAAARFAELEGQLQALFTVTARLSSLKLTNFLR